MIGPISLLRPIPERFTELLLIRLDNLVRPHLVSRGIAGDSDLEDTELLEMGFQKLSDQLGVVLGRPGRSWYNPSE